MEWITFGFAVLVILAASVTSGDKATRAFAILVAIWGTAFALLLSVMAHG